MCPSSLISVSVMWHVPIQVDSFSPEIEVRAVIEGQFLSRRLYAENLGCTLGECDDYINKFLYRFPQRMICAFLHADNRDSTDQHR